MILNREDWYSTEYVLFNIVNQLKYKYLSCMKKRNGKNVLSRYYLGYSLSMLKQSLSKLGINDPTTKIYFDLSYWKDESGRTPLINFSPSQREGDKNKFNDNFYNYFVGYDFAIDIDDESIDRAWESTKKIKELFDEYKLPYSLKFSGGKGFHFLIEDRWFNNKLKAKSKVIMFGKMAKVIMNVCGLKNLNNGGNFDDSIYDDRRIFKLAYSLQNKDGKEYVCLPLEDYQFNNFKLENMEMINIMNSGLKLFQRGLKPRDHNLTEKQLKLNVLNFIKEFK